MALRPPQHRIDAIATFVHPTDTAWDRDRIETERAAMKELGLAEKDHPVSKYIGGWTRYDIDAAQTLMGQVVTIRDYLDDSKQPTLWKLRRLTAEEWYEIQPKYERDVRRGDRPWAAYIHAGRIGIKSVENGPALEMSGGRLTPSDVQKLDEISHELLYAIGEAVYAASLDLREDERRPLG